jgi:hypothetical protein
VAERGPSERSTLAGAFRGIRRKDVDAEIAQLLDEGVFASDEDTIALATQYLGLVGEDVERRLDSLRHFLESVTQVIYQRFVAADSDAIALARVLSFRADPDELARLRDTQYAALRDAVVALDARARDGAREASIAFCISEAPRGFPWSQRVQPAPEGGGGKR